MTTLYDILIIGGGPSGLTAAIYTARADLKTLVIAGNPAGGQLMMTTEVENFPGFEHGIMGPTLIETMRKQAARFNTTIVNENVTELTGNFEQNFTVKTDASNTYKAKTVIVATGATANWLNLPNETRLRGKGVSACATCDGFFFKNKTVAVVGGGDSAMEEACFLTKFCPKVYVLVRTDQQQMKASKIMQKRAEQNEKIEFIFNVSVTDVLGENAVTGLELTNTQTNQKSTLPVQGLFLAIGHSPNTKFLNGFIQTEKGYAVAKQNTMSSVKGVFVAGDVYDYHYRQAITAAGYGCMAALDAEKFLAQNH